jgi:hypothetical protein
MCKETVRVEEAAKKIAGEKSKKRNLKYYLQRDEGQQNREGARYGKALETEWEKRRNGLQP